MKTTRSRTGPVSPGSFRIERFHKPAGPATIAQPKEPPRPSAHAPRPDLLPAGMRGPAAQAKVERPPGDAWRAAPRPERMGKSTMAVPTMGPPAHARTVLQRMHYQHERQKAKKEALLNPRLLGTCTFTFRSGKEVSVSATLSDPGGDSYIDITGKPFPTAIDMRSVTGITFAPNMGRQRTYSSWQYFHNGQWVGPRLTQLE